MTDYKWLGKRAKIRRIELDLAQKDLAEKIHMTPTYLGMIERWVAKPSFWFLSLLANELGVTVEFLLNWSTVWDDTI